MRLSQFDELNAKQLLERSLQLDAYNAPANIELGLDAESAGDYARAEKLMLEAFAIDHTFATRWALANFYFRRDNEQAFWEWAQSAARMPSDSVGALFELCWQESPDPQKISSVILNDNPKLIRQYIQFLASKDQLSALASASQRLVKDGNPQADTPQLFQTINQLVAANDGMEALELWHTMASRGWINADVSIVNNPRFVRTPLPASFDWILPSHDGLNSWIGQGGLEVEFTGRQPEICTIVEQTVVLLPGTYSLHSSYSTSEIPAETGIKWQIIQPGSDKPLVESANLSGETPQDSTTTFSLPQGPSLYRVRLVYQRALGTPRISGSLAVSSVQIESAQ